MGSACSCSGGEAADTTKQEENNNTDAQQNNQQQQQNESNNNKGPTISVEGDSIQVEDVEEFDDDDPLAFTDSGEDKAEKERRKCAELAALAAQTDTFDIAEDDSDLSAAGSLSGKRAASNRSLKMREASSLLNDSVGGGGAVDSSTSGAGVRSMRPGQFMAASPLRGDVVPKAKSNIGFVGAKAGQTVAGLNPDHVVG